MNNREKFWEWAKENTVILHRRSNTGSREEHAAWLGWQAALSAAPTPPEREFDHMKSEDLADILDDYSISGSHENDYPYASHLMQEAARLIRALQAAPTPPEVEQL